MDTMTHLDGKRVVDPTISNWEIHIFSPDFLSKGWGKKVEKAGGKVDTYRRDGQRYVKLPNNESGREMATLLMDKFKPGTIIARGPIEHAQAGVIVVNPRKDKLASPGIEAVEAEIMKRVERNVVGGRCLLIDDPTVVAATTKKKLADDRRKMAWAFHQHLLEKMTADPEIFWNVVTLLKLDVSEGYAFLENNKKVGNDFAVVGLHA